MARLQDFQTVTPTGSDNLLIVQSQGQGLSTLNAVGQKVATETTMSSLNTTSKNLVGAVNEVNNKKASDIEYSSGVTVKQAIDTLNNTSAVASATLQNVTSSSSIKYWKTGNIVTVNVDITLSTTGQWVTVTTLPAGFRPPDTLTTTGISPAIQGNTRYVMLASSGNITAYSQDSTRILFVLTYGI